MNSSLKTIAVMMSTYNGEEYLRTQIDSILPGDPNDYLSNLYGADYMTLPPVEKREKHFIVDIQFEENI